jgi:glycosyltransferase involved in cell wall biosynthesis
LKEARVPETDTTQPALSTEPVISSIQAPPATSRLSIAIIGDRGIPARYSGFSTLVEELAVRLVSDFSMDVTVYCRNHYYEQRESEYKGVRCVYLPAPGGKNLESIVHSNLAIAHALPRGYDLAFIVDPGNAPFALPLVLRGMPTVFHTDGLGWKRQKWGPLQRRYYKSAEWACARLATWLVTDSRAMQQYYVDEYGAPSSFIPYSGEVGLAPNHGCLATYGLEKGGYYLVVARVEPENNIDLIIREYRAAKVKRPLVVVGAARYQTPYSQRVMAEADETVRSIGGVFESDMLNGLYENCYAYLHGHEVGGTNPSLLRAMHAGAACVPIDVVFHREVVGDENLFFGKGDGDLAAIIRRLEDAPAHVAALGRSARRRSATLYRWDAVAAAYAEVFVKVVEARRGRTPYREALSKEVYRPWEFLPAEP